MADVESLITEARAFVGRENGLNWRGWIRELADALKKTAAERDRYRAEAESARKTGERILADALRYRAAIQDAYNAWHMETRATAIDILARALNENGEN